MKRFLDYNKKLSERAKEMRKNMTLAEKKIRLECLKNLQKNPPVFDHPLDKGDTTRVKIKVYPQRIIDNFIVDFYIPEFKIVIEIDGENHFTDDGKSYDEERTRVLEWLWISVLRFTNEEVISDFERVCEKIEKIISHQI